MEEGMSFIWVFNGASSHFPSGIFTTKELAEEWIARNFLTGMLTLYPVNVGVYDWAMNNNFFRPTKDFHRQPDFVQKFSSASQEHYHYEDGKKD